MGAEKRHQEWKLKHVLVGLTSQKAMSEQIVVTEVTVSTDV